MTRNTPFRTRSEIAAYLDQERIECLECGKHYRFLGPHLRQTHDIAVDEYRAKWRLPRGAALAGKSVRAARSATMRRLREDGDVTPEMGATARAAAVGAHHPAPLAVFHAEMVERMRRAGQARRQIPDGSLYSDGGLAERHRERNAAVRAAERGDFAPLDAYNTRYRSNAGRRILRKR